MVETSDPIRRLPEKALLAPPDGTPVHGALGLVWWQGNTIPEDAWVELQDPYTNGWAAQKTG